MTITFSRGFVHYELTNHLGNVLAVITDRKLLPSSGGAGGGSAAFYTSDVLTLTDYYAFGQAIQERTYNAAAYKYSMNGQEKDTDIDANHTTALYWEYDSRIGRRWNVDPIIKPWESPYMCFGNNPITGSDVLGNTTNGEHERDKDGNWVKTSTLGDNMGIDFFHDKESSFPDRIQRTMFQ